MRISDWSSDVCFRSNGAQIGRVDPGDSIGASVGLGFSINPEASFSFGYKHNYILETETEIDGTTSDSDDFHVGALLLGASYALNDSVSLNLTVEAGDRKSQRLTSSN